MQVTREQALQLIQENQSGQTEHYSSEIHILSLEPGTLPEFHQFHDEDITLQAECWVCEYEHREIHPGRSSQKPWGPWEKRVCYVVVPEPNPFVIVDA
jgi:hypothetical protein